MKCVKFSNFADTINLYNTTMRKVIIAAIVILACLPMIGMAQNNVWEVPDAPTLQKEVKKVKKEQPKSKTDKKYLAGAVPETDGKVVFTLDKDVPGLSADDIYNKVYAVMQQLVSETQDKDITPGSRIVAVNKAEHTIVANMREWLVFSSSFIQLDRTQFYYILIAEASDHHIKVSMQRISYAYEMNRGNDGMKVKAEDWITDKVALNKKQNKLARISGKFRVKTIDRKDNVFSRISKALGI